MLLPGEKYTIKTISLYQSFYIFCSCINRILYFAFFEAWFDLIVVETFSKIMLYIKKLYLRR